MTEVDQDNLGEFLSAYLDGELDDQQRQWVEQLLKENESARRMFNELQQTSQLVATLPRQHAPASIVEEFQLHQERDELLGDPITPPISSNQRRISFKAILSIAAALTVIVTGGLWMTRENGNTLPHTDGDLLAFAESDNRFDLLEKSAPTTRRMSGHDHTRSENQAAVANATGGGTFQNIDIATKLEAGTDVRAIQTHAFASETLRLKLNVRNASDRDKLTARLVKHLSNRKIQNLAQASGRSSMNSRSGSFFYQGKPAVNFTHEDQSQMIVRVPVEEMDRLLEKLSHDKNIDDRITLAAGPLTFRGIQEARSSLQRHDSGNVSGKESANPSSQKTPSDHLSRRDHSRSKRARKSTCSSMNPSENQKKKEIADQGLYDDLSAVTGLDRTTVEKMLKESKLEVEDSTTTTNVTMDYKAGSSQTGVNKPMKIESLASQSKITPPKKSPNQPQQYITFVVELNIDQPTAKPAAKTKANSHNKPKPKSKSQSKSKS